MKLLLIIPVLAIVFVAGCVGQSPTGEVSAESSQEPGVKTFSTYIQNFRYNPENINVNLGDTVRVTIQNRDSVTHGISLPIFGVSQFVRPGQITTIEFVADKTGNPETFCSTDHGEKLLINVIP